MRSRPYEVRHLKEAQEDLEARARNVKEILGHNKKSRQEKKGLLAKIFKWFS